MKCPKCGKKLLCYDCWSNRTTKKEFMKSYTIGFSGGIAVFVATLANDKFFTNVIDMTIEQILLRALISTGFFVFAFFAVGALGYILIRAYED